MRKVAIMVMLVGSLGLMACAPRVDASGTTQRLHESIEKVRLSMPEGERKEFVRAVTFLIGQQEQAALTSTQGTVPLQPLQLQEGIKKAVNGKTGRQIIEDAKAFGMQ